MCQSLQAIGVLEKTDDKGARRITQQGMTELDQVATAVYQELHENDDEEEEEEEEEGEEQEEEEE